MSGYRNKISSVGSGISIIKAANTHSTLLKSFIAGDNLSIEDNGLGMLTFASTGGGTVTHAPTFTINGGGSAITTGLKGMIFIPYACTITAVNVVCDQPNSSIVIDIWKIAQGSAPATITNSITASDQPTVSDTYESHDSTLTGWTKSIPANSYLYFNVNSASNATIAVITLTATGTT